MHWLWKYFPGSCFVTQCVTIRQLFIFSWFVILGQQGTLPKLCHLRLSFYPVLETQCKSNIWIPAGSKYWRVSISVSSLRLFPLIVTMTVAVLERTAILSYLLEDVNFEYITASSHALCDVMCFWISRLDSVSSGKFWFQSHWERNKK